MTLIDAFGNDREFQNLFQRNGAGKRHDFLTKGIF